MPTRSRPAAGPGLPNSPRIAIEQTVARLIDLLDGDPDFEAEADEESEVDEEAEPAEHLLGAPAGDGNQERWSQGDGDLEAQGTADDLVTYRRSIRDRAALDEIERQAQALARRLRWRGTPRPSAEPIGNLRLLSGE